MKLLFSILMALTAYGSLSIGFVLMKKGIHFLGWKGKKNRSYFKNLILWLTGFIVVNIYGVPSALALKNLPPHIVSAFAGFGIVVLIYFSRFILREKVYFTDLWYSILIVLAIILLNLSQQIKETSNINTPGMICLIVIPVILFITGFLIKNSPALKTAVFSCVSGFSAGLMVIFLSILVKKFNYQVADYLGSVFLYLYIVYALLSMIALQFANKNGPMMIIGPVQYSSTIIYPVIASLVVFRFSIPVIQYLSILIIIISVIFIMKRR